MYYAVLAYPERGELERRIQFAQAIVAMRVKEFAKQHGGRQNIPPLYTRLKNEKIYGALRLGWKRLAKRLTAGQVGWNILLSGTYEARTVDGKIKGFVPGANTIERAMQSYVRSQGKDIMSVFKIEGSPFYQYDFLFRGRRFRGSTKQTNKVSARRHESNLRQKLANDRSGIVELEPPPCFSDFATEFLERTKDEMENSTARGYKNSLQNVKSWFGASRLDEISADVIEKYKQSRLVEKRSPSTINREMGFVRRVLLYAVKVSRPSAGKQPLNWVLLSTPFVAHGVGFLKESRRERIISFDEERR